jgi:hypothetical protein
MNQQTEVFQPPSPIWKWFLIPLSALSICSVVFYTIALFNNNPPSLELKMKLIASVFALFASIYLITGYRYLVWTAELKNELVQLAIKHPEIICFRIGRYSINEQCCLTEQFKRLRHYEIEEVYHIVKNSSWRDHLGQYRF